MKKNTLSKILISVMMVGIFLLPISPSFEIKKSAELAIGVKTNKTNAASIEDLLGGSTTKIDSTNSNSVQATINLILASGYDQMSSDGTMLELYYNVNGGKEGHPEQGIFIKIIKTDTEEEVLNDSLANLKIPFDPKKTTNIINFNSGSILLPETNYTFSLYIKANNSFLFGIRWSGWDSKPEPFKTSVANENDAKNTKTSGTTASSGEGSGYSLGCSILDGLDGLVGCIAGVFYLFWTISAIVARLAGSFLDYLIYYSTDGGSYTNGFITKGWGAIRDVANIFFIVALLYIAIKMILSLGDSHSKKLIGTIVIVALLINFSLFFTQVIIDGSNILAKVFYNNIDSKYDNDKPATGAKGEKSISIGLIKDFNPQKIIDINAYNKSRATFIFITILLIAITLYTAYIFFSVGLLFVSRVVMLWLSMIFAPIAFASYTLPFEIPGLGHKDWWKNLLENAFLAPIFIFMLYLVVMFTGFLSELVQYPANDTSTWLQTAMSVVIPFIILAVLLMKAKEMAIKYAGEMGAAMQKAGAMVGGLAVGAATGGAALMGRGIAGRAGSAMANSKWANKFANSDNKFVARLGRASQDSGEYLGKSTFDARNTKLGEKAASKLGLDVGKASKGSEGGFEGAKKRKDEKRMERQKHLEDRQTKGKKNEIAEAESSLNELHNEAEQLKNAIAPEMNKLDKELQGLSKAFTDASEKAKLSGDPADKTAALEAQTKVKNKEREMLALKQAKTYTGDRGVDGKLIAGTSHNRYTGADYKTKDGNSLQAMEKTIIPNKEIEIKGKQIEISNIKKKIRNDHADRIDDGWNKTLNFVTSMGMHSGKGADSTAKKLRRVERESYSSAIPQPK